MIAGELNVTEGTVKSHVATIFDVLDVHNRVSAVAVAHRLAGYHVCALGIARATLFGKYEDKAALAALDRHFKHPQPGALVQIKAKAGDKDNA